MPEPTAPPRSDPGADANGRRRSARAAAIAGDDAVPRGIAVASALALRLLVIAGGIYLLGLAAGKLLLVVLPFVVALLLTTLLEPGARWLHRRAHFRPGLAAGAMVLLTALVVLGLLGLIVPAFVAQLADLGSRVREGTGEVADWLAPLGIDRGDVDGAIDRGIEQLRGNGGRIAGGVLTGALVAAEAAAAAILALTLTFFFVKDGRRLWSWSTGLFSEPKREHVEQMGERAWEALSAYVRGVMAVATFDAVLIGLALLVLGIPLAVPLIVLTFIAAFFPIVGAVAAGVAAVLVALVSQGALAAAILAVVIVAVQQIEGNVLYPVLVGRRLSIHPVAILLALTAGGVVAGVAGAFLAVPVAAVGAAVLDYARTQERRSTPVITP